jgi:hypothetical protein
MRHTISSLLIALSAALYSFVLTPLVALLLPRLFSPGMFADDTLVWATIFGGPFLLAADLTVALVFGTVAFGLAKARLPDREWKSHQGVMVLLPLVMFTAVAGTIGWRLHAMANPPEAGPQQTGLPSLRLARALAKPDGRSGIWRLAWSADGQRLASYNVTGIATWKPDGQFQKEFTVYDNLVFANLLLYLSGHRLLIASPLTDIDSAEAKERLRDAAFSILDGETGKVLQNIAGPHPGGGGPRNRAVDLAVSPDERLVAVSYNEPRIDIYSTQDWQHVASLDLNTGRKDDSLNPLGLAFSPDGKTLAVLHGFHGRVRFFEVSSWLASGELITYADERPPGPLVQTLAFAPDGTMIAVGSAVGGSWWTHPNGIFGPSVLKQESPVDPLRVYRISDGGLVAALGSFPGGLSQLVWSRNGQYLAFRDAVGGIRFWSPFKPNLSARVLREAAPGSRLLFSRDGSQLAALLSDGVEIFDIVPSSGAVREVSVN